MTRMITKIHIIIVVNTGVSKKDIADTNRVVIVYNEPQKRKRGKGR